MQLASRSATMARAPCARVSRPRSRCVAAAAAADESAGSGWKLCLAAVAASLVVGVQPSFADNLATFEASGLLPAFKDKVDVTIIEDDKAKGVLLYVSDFRRSDFDRFVSFGFVPEPTQASLSCIIAPGAALALDVGSLPASEEVFSESKARALFFIPNKSLHIRRLYDAKHRVLVYVSYSTRISAGEDPESKGQYKTGTCAIPLP